MARRPSRDIEGVQPIVADLLDPAGLRAALDTLRPTHIFFATWMRQPTEAENIKINSIQLIAPTLEDVFISAVKEPARSD